MGTSGRSRHDPYDDRFFTPPPSGPRRTVPYWRISPLRFAACVLLEALFVVGVLGLGILVAGEDGLGAAILTLVVIWVARPKDPSRPNWRL